MAFSFAEFDDWKDWPLILFTRVMLLLQLLMHVPFIYYIGKENALIAWDEYFYQNMSLMVSRVKLDEGDPRYYLAELVDKQHKPNEKVVFLHRLPHMKMKKSELSKVNNWCFAVMILIAVFYDSVYWIFDIISHFQDPFDQLILPGLFFYFRFRDKWLKEDVDI